MKNASRPNVKKSLQDAYATADAECLKQSCLFGFHFLLIVFILRCVFLVEEGGSTAVVAIVGGGDNGLFVANVGDSRAVLSRNGKAVDLSLDQKPDRFVLVLKTKLIDSIRWILPVRRVIVVCQSG